MFLHPSGRKLRVDTAVDPGATLPRERLLEAGPSMEPGVDAYLVRRLELEGPGRMKFHRNRVYTVDIYGAWNATSARG
jgi:hypothetical protein